MKTAMKKDPAHIQYLVERILGVCRDVRSARFYSQVARALPDDVIFRFLSEIKVQPMKKIVCEGIMWLSSPICMNSEDITHSFPTLQTPLPSFIRLTWHFLSHNSHDFIISSVSLIFKSSEEGFFKFFNCHIIQNGNKYFSKSSSVNGNHL